MGTVIDSTKIVEPPLNGHNFVQLAQVIPEFKPGTPGSITVRRGRGSIGQQDSPFGSTGMWANDSCDTANRIFVDATEIMDYAAMTFSFSPSVDSLTEFKVETSTYSADLGGAPGGQVNRVTRAGCSSYHGTSALSWAVIVVASQTTRWSFRSECRNSKLIPFWDQ